MLRLSSTSLDELHGRLFTKELSMARRKNVSSSFATDPFQAFSVQSQPPLLPTPSVFAAQHQLQSWHQPKSHNRGKNNRGNSFSHRGNRNFHNNRGHYSNNRGNRSYQSPRQAQGSSTFKVPCQICGSTSHKAIDCFDRMNPDICGLIPPAKLVAMYVNHSIKPSPSWLIDSGATFHITNDVANISSPTPYTGEDKVYIGDGKGLSIHHIGSSFLHTPHTSFQLRNVLHVPYMKHNLLSAYQFLKDNNCSLTFDPYGSNVKDRILGKMLLWGPVRDGFYPFQDSSTSSNSSHTALLSIKAPVKVWHRRLGHPSSSILRSVISNHTLALHGKSTVDFFCSDCALAKNHKLPFGVASSKTTQSLQLLHCDMWGLASVISNSGFKYYLLLVDDFSKYSWFFPLKSKSDVFSTFVVFKSKGDT
ncbi:hypothetical protein PS1_044272 [Malus domestica]